MISKHISRTIPEGELYDAYKLFFNTFASEQRLRILNLLKKKRMCVSDIQEATGYEQSVVSHNLRRLRACGFVNSEVNGKFRYYSLDSKTIAPIMKLIEEHMNKNCLKIVNNLIRTEEV